MSIVPKKQESLGFFNLVRGLGILMVIAGHSMALFLTSMPTVVTLPVFQGAGRVLGAGVMAMFFMISGFYFYRRSPRKCFSAQAKLLLKPYYLTGLAIFVGKGLTALIGGSSYLNYGMRLVLTFLLGINAGNGETLFGLPLLSISIFWFIWALFGGWVIYNWIMHISDGKIRNLCVLACVVVGWFLTGISKAWPVALHIALLAVGYLAVGYEIGKRQLIGATLSKPVWFVVVLVALVSLAFGNADIASGYWKLGLLDVAGSFCVSFLLLRLYGKLMKREYYGRFAKLMENTGLYSIWILCLHAFEKEVIPWHRLAWVFPDQPGLCMVICFFGRCLVIALLFVLVFRIRKIFRSKRRERIIIIDDV